jgi:16S rRNA (cytidine1402-2'-O)-methyltransferase
MPGTLFVVATPIGNLEDLTFRALRTLRDVHLIAAEDTRRTSKLLAHYGVQKPLVSLHEHNEGRETPRLVERLLKGEDVALVSDAGTPGIADPGQELVAAARAAGVAVVPIPGPSAITAALSASGLPGDSFVFVGFPPSSGLGRQRWLDAIRDEPRRVAFFEAPHRIERTLTELRECFPERPIFIARELTKIHEDLVFWDKHEVHPDSERTRGEFVGVIAASDHGETSPLDTGSVLNLFGLLTKHVSLDEESCVRAVAAITGHPVNKVRTAIKKARIAARRASEA